MQPEINAPDEYAFKAGDKMPISEETAKELGEACIKLGDALRNCVEELAEALRGAIQPICDAISELMPDIIGAIEEATKTKPPWKPVRVIGCKPITCGPQHVHARIRSGCRHK